MDNPYTNGRYLTDESYILEGKAVPNASEMQRNDEEAFEHAFDMAHKLTLSKSEREGYLREVRRLGKLLGYNSTPYNGHPDEGSAL